MARFHVPIIVTVTGEGGSGGALALGIGDRVLMLEHSTYSVISPEGCASILWKDAARKKDAAEAMKLTASDLRELDVIDEIVPEPPGGAHADPAGAAAAVGEAVERHLAEVADLTAEERRERRYRRFRALGRFETAGTRDARRGNAASATRAEGTEGRARKRTRGGGTPRRRPGPRAPRAGRRMNLLVPAVDPAGRGLSVPSRDTPRVDAVWGLAAEDAEAAGRFAREAGVSPLLAALLQRRGVATAAEARRFLAPEEGDLHEPRLLAGAADAADLLVATARRGRRVVVFGDYDVDGVTAVAQLRAALSRVGADAAAFIPHRLRDGYGLKPDTVRRVLAELRPAAIVTVDCGITAVEGVAGARAAGVDVIVTDHHLVPAELPAGAIVVNPRQPGCPYPYKELAATGIAMKIAEAVGGVGPGNRSRLAAAGGVPRHDRGPRAARRGEPHDRGARSRALARARAPGIRALLAEAGLSPGASPTSEEVAFRVAPRLNAAGRLDTAMLALSLFEERDAVRAGDIARELSARNAERQALESGRRRRRAPADRPRAGGAVLIEADAGWHRGVLGIAASRLAREYHRPVLLFGFEGERASGSGRSIPGVSLHGILKELAGHFDEFGGHEQAVGASLPVARFDAFRRAARDVFRARVPAEALVRRADAEAELPLEALEAPWPPSSPASSRTAPAIRDPSSSPAASGRRGRSSPSGPRDSAAACARRAATCGHRLAPARRVRGARRVRPALRSAVPRRGRPRSMGTPDRDRRGATGRRGRGVKPRRPSSGSSLRPSVRRGPRLLVPPGPAPLPRTRLPRAVPAPGDGLRGQATTLLDGFDFTEESGGKPLLRIKADRTIGYGAGAGLAPDLYAGEKVTLTVYPDDGAPVIVHADRGTYDERTREAQLSGNVRWIDEQGSLAETAEGSSIRRRARSRRRRRSTSRGARST